MSEIMWYSSFSIWLISLSIIPARSIKVTYGRISFFFMASVCVFIFFTHSFIRCIDDFHRLTSINKCCNKSACLFKLVFLCSFFNTDFQWTVSFFLFILTYSLVIIFSSDLRFTPTASCFVLFCLKGVNNIFVTYIKM